METTRRRHAETTVFSGGRNRENFVAVETRTFDIGSQNVHQRIRLGHRFNRRKVEAVDVGEVVEHAVELPGVTLDLVCRHIESGETRDLRDVGGGEACC